MFWIARFIFDWLVWIVLADKSRWREIIPVCFFASWVSYIVEAIMLHYQLWSYTGHHLLALNINGFGCYIVATYLFIQWLPTDHSFKKMFIYWLYWTGFVIVFELFHVWMGELQYYKWWNTIWSYLADWFLFWVFYKYHQIFCASKARRPLSRTKITNLTASIRKQIL